MIICLHWKYIKKLIIEELNYLFFYQHEFDSLKWRWIQFSFIK